MENMDVVMVVSKDMVRVTAIISYRVNFHTGALASIVMPTFVLESMTLVNS